MGIELTNNSLRSLLVNQDIRGSGMNKLHFVWLFKNLAHQQFLHQKHEEYH